MPAVRWIVIAALVRTVTFAQPPNSSAGLALTGGTIYTSPTAAPIRNGVVLIRDGKISAAGGRGAVRIPRGTPSLDCYGRTIVAGFWNSHVHFFERKWANAGDIPAAELTTQLQDMLTRFGFTSVFDLGSAWENTRQIRDRVLSGEAAGPRIRSTGTVLVPPNPGIPGDAILGVLGMMSASVYETADGAQASAAAATNLAAGVDGIKLFASTPSKSTLSADAIEAAVKEAHRAGKPVFVHPNSGADVLAAVRGGVDIIGHTTPRSGPWDQTILNAMKERRVALIPTLQIFEYQARHDRRSAQDQIVETSTAQLRAWVASGGTVLFGTDVGAVDYDPAPEYTLMARAGMNFRQILAALTAAPAAQFGESGQSGRIESGLTADLVVLRDDPARGVRAFTSVQYTIRAGKVIYRANP